MNIEDAMQDVETILRGLGPAERLALATRQATQQTADRLAAKKLSRYIQGPPRRAYAKTVKLRLELTPLGEQVADMVSAESPESGTS